MSDVKVTKDLENKKLIIEFTANGPVEKVWQAYAQKDLFEKWWGPEGWETTAKEFDFVPGGRVHYGMKCVDENQGEWFGQTSWGVMQIETVEDGKRFTYKDYFSDEAGSLNEEMPALKITNEFIEEDGKTKIVSTSLADSAEQIEQLIQMGMVEGFSSQLNKLDTLLG
ncbi:MAG TPA: SRPBCC domain-containing protein [Candidatus Saccharimonadales bacterium]|nr:SRPBCC domain-containing protein [Candidatus Saccharimonadales bacterium]